jgi:hypothetical protein
VLREAARIVAESPGCIGVWEAIVMLPRGPSRVFTLNKVSDAVELMFPWPQTRLPFNEPHRHLRVMLLLFAAEAVLTGDCDD